MTIFGESIDIPSHMGYISEAWQKGACVGIIDYIANVMGGNLTATAKVLHVSSRPFLLGAKSDPATIPIVQLATGQTAWELNSIVIVDQIDLTPYNKIIIELTSLFIKDEDPKNDFPHTSALWDYGFFPEGKITGDTYIVDKTKPIDERWERYVYIKVDFDDSHQFITYLEYKTTYKDIKSDYREVYGFETKKEGVWLPWNIEGKNPLTFEKSGEPYVFNIVKYFYKRRYREGTEDEDSFDYIEHKGCDIGSTIKVTFLITE